MKSNYKEILVPLNWHELDEILLALRLMNSKYCINNELEKKISNWSMKAKENK